MMRDTCKGEWQHKDHAGCAHLVLAGHGCLQSPGEATSFIHFQLSWLEGADGATAPGQELAFGVGLRMEPSISPIACCTHSQAIRSHLPLVAPSLSVI